MRQSNSSPANSKPKSGASAGPKGKKIPRKITETYLHNAGLHYLGRFSASSKHFHEVLRRKVQKSCAHHTEQNFEQCMRLVDALVEKFVRAGLLDDAVYAKGLVTSLRRQGKSSRAIEAKMQIKGVPRPLTKQELENHDSAHGKKPEETEFQAALKHARKRKLGPFRGTKEADVKKELANMARAGFSYETARRVFDVSGDDLEAFEEF